MRRGGSGVIAMLSFACRVPLKAAFSLSSARGSHKAPSSGMLGLMRLYHHMGMVWVISGAFVGLLMLL